MSDQISAAILAKLLIKLRNVIELKKYRQGSIIIANLVK